MYLRNLSASLVYFFKKSIDKETLKKRKEFKETRKKGRKIEKEREGERKGQRKGHSFRELSSHVKGSYDYAPNCICIQISVSYYFILQFIFHIWTIKPTSDFI